MSQVMVKRMLFWAGPALALCVLLALAFRPTPALVDLAVVKRQPLIVTLDEEGETRVHDVFTVSAPIAGRLMRTELHVGDPVVAGETIVAQIEPTQPSLLDPRARAEAEAAVRASEAAARLARADRERANSERDFAAKEVKRMRELHTKGVVSQQSIEDAERAERSTNAAAEAASAALNMREYEFARARAALIAPAVGGRNPAQCACVELKAPVSGKVLTIYERSENVVQPAAPLIDLGDPHQMELVVDYLSNVAVSIEAGQRAFIDGWGGSKPLNARVRRVEPSAFTKVSALGIEEQRVNVILDITEPFEVWKALGHGYRVDVHVVTWESPGVAIVPLTALFRYGDGWALFVDHDGRAERRAVAPGHRSGLDVEITEGIGDGERVVVNPSQRIEDGTRIASRATS